MYEPMTPEELCVLYSGNEAAALAVASRFFARQPILDAQGLVLAYELLFRDGSSPLFRGDGESASNTMIDNAVVFGLGSLTNGLPGFVNCTAETLTSDALGVLPPEMTVLEILESVEPTPTLVEACSRLKAKGYRLALDDFAYRPSLDPLISLADYIKVDFLATSAEQRRNMLAQIGHTHATLVAEKIETEAAYRQANREGFTLFQGFYFCKPLLVKKHKVPSNRTVHLKLLQMLQEHPLNIVAISEIVQNEPSLAYRLLRYVNSPACGVRGEVSSIYSALITVGDDMFRRIATLAVASELNAGPSGEILRIALVRAKFCELAAPCCGFDATEQYLLGLFSLLDAMLQMPMEKAICNLSLSQPIREALLGVPNSNRCPLYWLELHERGEFRASEELAQSHGFSGAVLVRYFADAVSWADQLLSRAS